jgi:hypothetical protein
MLEIRETALTRPTASSANLGFVHQVVSTSHEIINRCSSWRHNQATDTARKIARGASSKNAFLFSAPVNTSIRASHHSRT